MGRGAQRFLDILKLRAGFKSAENERRSKRSPDTKTS